MLPDLGAYTTLPARSTSLEKGRCIGSLSPSRISSTALVALNTGSMLASQSIRNCDPSLVMCIGIPPEDSERDRNKKMLVAAVQNTSSKIAMTNSTRGKFHQSLVGTKNRTCFSAVV